MKLSQHFSVTVLLSLSVGGIFAGTPQKMPLTLSLQASAFHEKADLIQHSHGGPAINFDCDYVQCKNGIITVSAPPGELAEINIPVAAVNFGKQVTLSYVAVEDESGAVETQTRQGMGTVNVSVFKQLKIGTTLDITFIATDEQNRRTTYVLTVHAKAENTEITFAPTRQYQGNVR